MYGWYGTVQYGTVRDGTVRDGTLRYGPVWYGRYGTVWYGRDGTGQYGVQIGAREDLVYLSTYMQVWWWLIPQVHACMHGGTQHPGTMLGGGSADGAWLCLPRLLQGTCCLLTAELAGKEHYK